MNGNVKKPRYCKILHDDEFGYLEYNKSESKNTTGYYSFFLLLYYFKYIFINLSVITRQGEVCDMIWPHSASPPPC